MKHFRNIADLNNLSQMVESALKLKQNPLAHQTLGQGKSIGLLFFNSSLRTRLSTQKAAQNLGMNVTVMNFNQDAWKIEFEEGAVMNVNTTEHIKEAAQVISQYFDIIGIRAFANLSDKIKDESENVLSAFIKYGSIPVINMESATAHPLQALADAITLQENNFTSNSKVVLTWAPHPKALPHAVANSFIQMMKRQKAQFVLTHPKGYELSEKITEGVRIEHDQEKAFQDADFIYAKNWSSYSQYGQVLKNDFQWTITQEKMFKTKNAKFMHCLPVRRNVVVSDSILDSSQSLVIEQANNRTYSAQAIIKSILEA